MPYVPLRNTRWTLCDTTGHFGTPWDTTGWDYRLLSVVYAPITPTSRPGGRPACTLNVTSSNQAQSTTPARHPTRLLAAPPATWGSARPSAQPAQPPVPTPACRQEITAHATPDSTPTPTRTSTNPAAPPTPTSEPNEPSAGQQHQHPVTPLDATPLEPHAQATSNRQVLRSSADRHGRESLRPQDRHTHMPRAVAPGG